MTHLAIYVTDEENIMNLITALIILYTSLIPIPPLRVETSNRPPSFRSETTLIQNTNIIRVIQNVPKTRLKVVDFTRRVLNQLPIDTPVKTTIRVARIEIKSTPSYGIKVINRTAVDYPQADKNYVTQRIREVFGVNADKAIKIAMCESGLRSNAVSSTNDYGIFQIHYSPKRGTYAQLLDAEYNIQFAYRMSGGGTNWQAWSCRKVLI